MGGRTTRIQQASRRPRIGRGFRTAPYGSDSFRVTVGRRKTNAASRQKMPPERGPARVGPRSQPICQGSQEGRPPAGGKPWAMMRRRGGAGGTGRRSRWWPSGSRCGTSGGGVRMLVAAGCGCYWGCAGARVRPRVRSGREGRGPGGPLDLVEPVHLPSRHIRGGVSKGDKRGLGQNLRASVA